MPTQMRIDLGLYLWEVFQVDTIEITYSGSKYRRETKWVCCTRKNGRKIRFLWYEVELLPQRTEAGKQKED